MASILLSRSQFHLGFASRTAWLCSNLSTGHVSLDVEVVKSAIRRKNSIARSYSRDDLEELWLVITATGETISNHAGPISVSGALADSEIQNLCDSSPFDRIYFWERASRWHRSLKPNQTPVQYVC